MQTIDQIEKYVEEVGALRDVAGAFTDIASLRLQKVRRGIERNRVFASDLARVLHIVRVTAEEHHLSAKRQKKISASLVITSNKRFYFGVLDAKVLDFYLAHTAYTGYVDRFIVGTVGRDLLKEKKYPYEFSEVSFAKELPDSLELANLVARLSQYQKVMVYFPRFVSILSQQPSFVDVTGFASGVGESGQESHQERYYIFEPEIDKILDFFEQKVMAIVLQQAFLESELARIGTQLSLMDQAASNATKVLSQENQLLKAARRNKLNLQVLEMYAGTKRKPI